MLLQNIVHDTSQTAKDNYSENNSIKFEPETIKSNLCDYSDAYILVTNIANIAFKNTNIAFKNCAPFSACKSEFNEVFVDKVDHIYISQCLCTI